MAKKKFEMEWSDEELRCVFNAVVVRNSSIAQRYPGGLSAFVEVCPYTYCNEKILTYSSMGGEPNRNRPDQALRQGLGKGLSRC